MFTRTIKPFARTVQLHSGILKNVMPFTSTTISASYSKKEPTASDIDWYSDVLILKSDGGGSLKDHSSIVLDAPSPSSEPQAYFVRPIVGGGSTLRQDTRYWDEELFIQYMREKLFTPLICSSLRTGKIVHATSAHSIESTEIDGKEYVPLWSVYLTEKLEHEIAEEEADVESQITYLLTNAPKIKVLHSGWSNEHEDRSYARDFAFLESPADFDPNTQFVVEVPHDQDIEFIKNSAPSLAEYNMALLAIPARMVDTDFKKIQGNLSRFVPRGTGYENSTTYGVLLCVDRKSASFGRLLHSNYSVVFNHTAGSAKGCNSGLIVGYSPVSKAGLFGSYRVVPFGIHGQEEQHFMQLLLASFCQSKQ